MEQNCTINHSDTFFFSNIYNFYLKLIVPENIGTYLSVTLTVWKTKLCNIQNTSL